MEVIMKESEKSERVRRGPVFLRNEWMGTVVRSIVGNSKEWFCKFPGEKEYKVHHSTQMVTDAWLEWVEITKEEYDKF
jgi:hypothetical protein